MLILLLGAAHACGHNAQIATMLGVAVGLSVAIFGELGGDVFMAVPAENSWNWNK